MKPVQSDFIKWISARKAGQLAAFGLIAGLLLAQGAPLGLLLHTYLFGPALGTDFWQHSIRSIHEQASLYLYVWLGTSFYFSAFGFGMAKLTSIYLRQLQSSRSALSLFNRFDDVKRNLRADIHGHLHNPVASLVEFIEGLRGGLFGKFSPDQLNTLETFLQSVVASHNSAATRLRPKDTGVTLRSALKPLASQLDLTNDDSEDLDTPVLVDEELLLNAFHEIFSALKPGVRARIGRGLETSGQWPAETYLIFTVEGAESIDSAGDSWAIVRHVFEWYSGGFWQEQQSRKLCFALPKAAPSKSRAA